MDSVDEPVISSSGRKRKIKAETFSLNLEKEARHNVEGKAPFNVCTLITSIIYDHNNNVCQASTSSEESFYSKT